MFSSKLKFLTFFVLIVFSSSTALAAPRTTRSRSSRSKTSSSSRPKSGSTRMIGNTSGKPNSYYSGITNHEAAAEKQKEIDKEYQEQVRAIKEGRTPPPLSYGGSKQQQLAARKAALEEKRAKLAEERELRRLEREAKKEERLAAAAERRAKKEERRAGKKKPDEELPDVESEISKKPKAKATPAEPDKIEGF